MKNEILKSKKAMKVVYFFLVAMLLFVSIALYFYAQNAERKNNQQKENVNSQTANEGENATTINETDYQLNEGDYAIDVQEKDGNKILKNEKAGILLTVPNDWQPNLVYNTKNNKELKLKAYKSYSEHPEVATELSDGVMLEIYMYENRSLNLKDWLNKEKIDDCETVLFNDFDSCKRVEDFLEADEDDFDTPPYDNWMLLSYFIKKEEKIYEISCYSVGEEYKKYNSECDNLLLNNIVLE